MKKLIVICGLLIVLIIAGCDRDNDVDEKWDAGTLVAIDYFPPGFNRAPRTRVETTKGVFCVRGTLSAMKDSRVRCDGRFLFINNKRYRLF